MKTATKLSKSPEAAAGTNFSPNGAGQRANQISQYNVNAAVTPAAVKAADSVVLLQDVELRKRYLSMLSSHIREAAKKVFLVALPLRGRGGEARKKIRKFFCGH